MGLTNLKARLGGSVALDEGGESVIDDATDIAVTFTKAAADGAAGDATADTLIWANPFSFPVKIMAARYTPTSGALTAHDTNFATLLVKGDDGLAAGAAPATALSLPTVVANGNFTQNDFKAFPTWTAANSVVPAGGGIWFAITKAASGVVVPAGLLTVRVRKQG